MYDHNRIKNHISGVESCSYELFGAHIENDGVSFSVYAPGAANVKLIASHNNWEEISMERDTFGVWSAWRISLWYRHWPRSPATFPSRSASMP